mgnify:CR=1 FL=1|jgi:hypothetical protein
MRVNSSGIGSKEIEGKGEIRSFREEIATVNISITDIKYLS